MGHHDSPNPPSAPRKHHSQDSAFSDSTATTISRAKKRRYPIDDDNGDRVECSDKYCRSCSADMIGDCVALCCCPCALVNLLTLALVKVSWMVGRKCLGLVKSRDGTRNRKWVGLIFTQHTYKIFFEVWNLVGGSSSRLYIKNI
ncbi:hypothetical protein ACLB2K_059943 [Fragaria x ananassa]